jgi:hypothetical protein
MVSSSQSETWTVLERFLAHDISLRELNEWVLSHPDTEQELGHKHYLALISADVSRPQAQNDIEKLVAASYEASRPGRLLYDRAARLAGAIVSGEADFLSFVSALARMHSEGNEWVPIIFVGIISEYDDIPRPPQYHLWEPGALAAKLSEAEARMKHYRPIAVEAARELIEKAKGA